MASNESNTSLEEIATRISANTAATIKHNILLARINRSLRGHLVEMQERAEKAEARLAELERRSTLRLVHLIGCALLGHDINDSTSPERNHGGWIERATCKRCKSLCRRNLRATDGNHVWRRTDRK